MMLHSSLLILGVASLLAPALAHAHQHSEVMLVPFNADDDDQDGVRDYEDDQVNGSDDLADLALVPLPAGNEIVEVSTDAPAGAVRLFWLENKKQVASALSGETLTLPKTVAPGDAVLVEAAQPRGLPVGSPWDGKFSVTVKRGDTISETHLQVAPLLVRPGTAAASHVFVREFPERNDRLIEQLTDFCAAARCELHVVPSGDPYDYNHIWLQDAIEFLSSAKGDSPFAKPGWSLSLSLAANRNRAIDLFPKDRLLGPSIGWIQVGEYRKQFAEGEGGASWIDWYGNLEASPPTKAYPEGRVLYGTDAARSAQLHPAVVDFLAAQQTQPPLALDVGWLTIKHTDEMVSFLPAKDGGFYVAAPDPTAAINTLRELQSAGHGATQMLDVFEQGVTIDSILADEDFIQANERLWAERIEPMAKTLCEGIGVSPDRLKRLPVLFQPSGLPRTPNVVNCLVANGHVAMADPNGPIIDGVDQLQAAVAELLTDAAVELHFVDDRQYHKWSGNVHCATNALRPIE